MHRRRLEGEGESASMMERELQKLSQRFPFPSSRRAPQEMIEWVFHQYHVPFWELEFEDRSEF